MGKINVNLSDLKAAGIYTIEIDNSVRSTTSSTSNRLLVGFNAKGPFNRPVFLQKDSDRLLLFGDIDPKMEHKGCYFNRMLKTLLAEGPTLALNLLKVDDSYNGPDQVNYAAMSLNAGAENPEVSNKTKTYGEYDYLAESVDYDLYGTSKDDVIPFVGTTPYSSLYNRSRFWTADKELLTAAAARGLNTADYANGAGSYEHTNLLNFANVGTEEISILVFKPENIIGYDITAESWYGGKENIPYGWIRPGDYISDYFIQVVCVKGNWSNYPILSTDPIWSQYFDKKGVVKEKVNNFISSEGVQLLGSWSGIIIPDFIDKRGANLSIEKKINAATESTGLLMSFNEDAAQIINFDYTGIDSSDEDYSCGEWGYDIDGDNEMTADNGETALDNHFIVDMVGHEVFKNESDDTPSIEYEYIKPTEFTEMTDKDGDVKYAYNTIHANVFGNQESVTLLQADENAFSADINANVWATDQANDFVETSSPDKMFEGVYVFASNELKSEKGTENMVIKNGLTIAPVESFEMFSDASTDSSLGFYEMPVEEVSEDGITVIGYKLNKDVNYASFPSKVCDKPEDKVFYAPGVYLPTNFIAFNDSITLANTINNVKSLIGSNYYILSKGSDGKANLSKKSINTNTVNIISNEPNGDVKEDNSQDYDVAVSFVISGNTYIAYFTISVDTKTNVIFKVAPTSDEMTTYIAYSLLQTNDINKISNIEEVGNYSAIKLSNDEGEVDTTYAIGSVAKPIDDQDEEEKQTTLGVNFLSYNYIYDKNDVDESAPEKCVKLDVHNVKYFNDLTNWGATDSDIDAKASSPISNDALNMFIVTSDATWDDKYIKVGDFVKNITYYNNPGEANQYKLIPGITRVLKKQFLPILGTTVTVDGKEVSYNYISYKGKQYPTTLTGSKARNGAVGVYLFTTADPVLIEKDPATGKADAGNEGEGQFITRQLPLSDDAISHSLRFIPMKGLKLSSRHKPGYDENGNISIEDGIEKIYGVLEESGIKRGLCNPAMVDYRYIIDSMSYGLAQEMGGKVHLSILAEQRGKCTALLNMPSAKQFATSSNPYFCDSYITGLQTRPSFNVKYIPEGGNTEMGSSALFSLPTEDDGSKFTACFFPNLIYNDGGKTASVPPAADVANVMLRKYNGLNNPYAISANMDGIISNKYVTGIEYDADITDREYLEPFGVNTIIREDGRIMIYGNQTAYQELVSDYNKLHVRENLNTLEIECYNVLKKYNFKYNTPALRAQVVKDIAPIISNMQIAQAIDKADIVCDESNNTPDIIERDMGIVDIGVWFNHGMEKIIQRITVNRFGTQND